MHLGLDPIFFNKGTTFEGPRKPWYRQYIYFYKDKCITLSTLINLERQNYVSPGLV